MNRLFLSLFIATTLAATHAQPATPDSTAPAKNSGFSGPLTSMDMVGPDGLVYPNWTWAGVQGGIPAVAGQVALADKGAKPETDIADLLETTANDLGAHGGGAITLGAGTFYLDRPIFIRSSNVVIRGSGRDQTKLLFRYNIPKGTLKFYGVKDGDTFEDLYIAGNPDGIKKLMIFVDGKPIASMDRFKNDWGNRFYLSVNRTKVKGAVGTGVHHFDGEIDYDDGTQAKSSIALNVLAETAPNTIYGQLAAISFAGVAPEETAHILLAADGVRGSDTLTLENAATLHKGDHIFLNAPPTDRWDKESGNVNTAKWAFMRSNEYEIDDVSGNAVKLNQPLRLDFPQADGSFVVPYHPISGSGIEDLTLEQVENLWISGVHFTWSWNCWAKDVKVSHTGRHPIFMLESKFGEVRNCVFDGAQFKGDAGSAYGGFERSYDCLMDGVESDSLRHGPIFNWACSGDVIRNCNFHDSEAHWHAGYTNQNLIENCVVEAINRRYGMIDVGPKIFHIHGPQGPRNVVYNCDIQVPRGAGNDAGVWMMGQNHDWLFAYNRFVVKFGVGMRAQDNSTGHQLVGNVFCIEHKEASLIDFQDATCTGWQFLHNRIYGDVAALVNLNNAGTVDQDNTFASYQLADRPTPPVPSIFEWERQQRHLSSNP